jgi:magnesium chelatase family protein
MSLAIVHTRALDGLAAPPVTVEVHLANGLPGFSLVGLADTEVKEARDRVRAALATLGLDFPMNRRITVSLAPADLPKASGRFDLPIALGILAASGQVAAARLAGLEFAGELSLAGELRPVREALALALAVRRQSPVPAGAPRRALVLPAESAREAARVPGLVLYGASHLRDVVSALAPDATCGPDGGPALARPAAPPAASAGPAGPDLADVRGQPVARRALEIAAAGGHGLLLIGPPGTGKSMLAQRLAGLLPTMDEDEALEAAALAGLARSAAPPAWGVRPLRQPHHSASAVALVGGGSPPRPGEISLAHGGVLFLDELPEFQRTALEALREPLETGRITISRASRQAEFPARFQFVAAMNPCPCGWLGHPRQPCRCAPAAIERYQGRLSGPLLDRIDLQVEVPPMDPRALAALPPGEPTLAVARRVHRARTQALRRQGVENARLPAADLDNRVRLSPEAHRFGLEVAERLGWSARSWHRMLRVALTITDLDRGEHDAAKGTASAREGAAGDTTPVEIGIAPMAEAVQFRRALAAR